MKEQFESLSTAILKSLAKSLNIKGYSTMKKDELVNVLVEKENEQIESDRLEEEKTRSRTIKKTESVEKEKKDEEGRKEPEKREPEKREPEKKETEKKSDEFNPELDSGIVAKGILDVVQDGGFGFIRSANFLPGDNDVYVSPGQIRRLGLKTGDIIEGTTKIKTQNEKFSAIYVIRKVNGLSPEIATKRGNFEDMTPIFPNEKIRLERPGAPGSMGVRD